ncbi:MAG: hypothetical protein ACF8GE_01750 [Phycisphaerales bacterium JB043]
MTPPIPDWIRTYTLDGYTSIYQLCPDESRVFGTEDLYGDWNGRILLMAKDFACSRLIHERVAGGDVRPYRHEPSVKANTTLRRYAERCRTGNTPETCGMLYGSALGGLLRDDGEMSGTLPNRKEAMAFGARIVGFTIEHMPNLEAIVCLGEEAWRCTSSATGHRMRWRDARESGEAVCVGGLRLHASYHPAARVRREVMESLWNKVNGEGGSQLSVVNQATAGKDIDC